MPKKKKDSSKQAATAPIAAATAPNPPFVRGVKDPILGSGPPKDYEDWVIKNARAKELIMSALTPGTEPWKIAEPLEKASDIWKALEAKYAGKRPAETSQDPALQEQQSAAPAVGPASAPIAKGDIMEELPMVEEDSPKVPLVKAAGEAQASAITEFYSSMPNRDQRFLWALLHGGKPETDAWFYGKVADD